MLRALVLPTALCTRILAYGDGGTGCAALARHPRSSHVRAYRPDVVQQTDGPGLFRRAGSGTAAPLAGLRGAGTQEIGSPAWPALGGHRHGPSRALRFRRRQRARTGQAPSHCM